MFFIFVPILGFSNLGVVCLQTCLGGLLIDLVFGLATKVEKSRKQMYCIWFGNKSGEIKEANEGMKNQFQQKFGKY